MTRRSPDSAPIDPTEQAIRDELPREVLSYAEGLRRQMYEISRRYGVEKPADIGPKIASGEVSLEDMQRMIELKELLEATVAEKKIPRSALRATEERQAERDAAFAKGLETIGEVLDFGEARDASFDASRPYLFSRQLEAAIEALPLVPFDRIVSDERFVENLAMRLRGFAREQQSRQSVGMVASMIASRTIQTMPEAMRDLVTQDVDGDVMVGLGFRWAGGTLRITGATGSHVGAEMSGGAVIADKTVGSWSGTRMSGGLLQIKGSVAAHCAGSEMTGGLLWISAAGDDLGMEMRGGSIIALRAADNAGNGMRDGEIEIKSCALNWLGKNMRGGRIKADSAELYVGESMVGGTIEVRKAGDGLGLGMKDGTISVGSCGSVGRHMAGGEILISGRAKEIGEKKTGGTIRYVGPLAWWKNLFI